MHCCCIVAVSQPQFGRTPVSFMPVYLAPAKSNPSPANSVPFRHKHIQ